MQIFSLVFDEGSCALDFHRCLFEYKGREFMIYPGNNERYMSIDTVIQDDNDGDVVFELIHEFLYLFGWRNKCYFHFLDACSSSGNRELLLQRKDPVFWWPRRFIHKTDFDFISSLDASEKFKQAVSLYNDAFYTNDIFYRFFCLYKILDIPISKNPRGPEDWINNNIKKISFNNNCRVLAFINSKSNLGEFMRDECRNALSHIHRSDFLKKSILPYRACDFESICYANTVLKELVIFFIENEIGEPKQSPINILSME